MSDSDNRPDDVFDIDRIRRLVELMEGHDLREIDLRHSEQRIRLCRGAETTYLQPMAIAASCRSGSSAGSSRCGGTGGRCCCAPARREPENENIVMVKSPMVGTFYARPNPNAGPFVKIGDMVQPETTICIIEAMKVFNEIPAETRGKIVAVLVDDEEPVDFGRPLFKVDTGVV